MIALRSQLTLRRLDELRRELTDLAFVLDRRGQPSAADVALAVSGRLGEIAAECAGASPVEPDGPSDLPSSSHRGGTLRP